MQYSAKLALAAACLASIASAKPIQHESRQYVECPKGSFYIKCWNDHSIEGCFTKYPCDESSDRAATTTTTTAAVPSGTDSCEDEDEDEGDEEIESTTCTPGRFIVPDLYTLFPGDKSKTSDAQTRIEVRNQTGETGLELAAHFELPAGATSCSLGWMMNVIGKRNFKVVDSGLLRITQFNDFPEDDDVSWNTIEPLVEAANNTAKHGDMTFWDQPEFNTARNHSIGSVECSPDVYLKIQLESTNGEGHVIMDQDSTNGFFIDYKC